MNKIDVHRGTVALRSLLRCESWTSSPHCWRLGHGAPRSLRISVSREQVWLFTQSPLVFSLTAKALLLTTKCGLSSSFSSWVTPRMARVRGRWSTTMWLEAPLPRPLLPLPRPRPRLALSGGLARPPGSSPNRFACWWLRVLELKRSLGWKRV